MANLSILSSNYVNRGNDRSESPTQQIARKEDVMRPLPCAVLSGLLLAVCLFWMTALPASAQSPATQPVINPALEKALLAEDWKQVSELIGEVKPETPTVLRFLKGHACLALNQNNDSVTYFRDSGEPKPAEEWDTWTKSFSADHSDMPVVAYLRGDALARAGRHQDAIATFSRGLQRNPKHPLALNARAVTYSYLAQWNEAIVDLDDAAKALPGCADIHNNRGTINVRRSLGAPGALAAFERALACCPNFKLAIIGRASALYGLGKWEEARSALHDLQDDPEYLRIVDVNLLVQSGAIIQAAVNSTEEVGPGVAVDRQRLDLLSSAKKELGESARLTSDSWKWKCVSDTFKDLATGFKYAGSRIEAFMPSVETGKITWNPGGGIKQLGSDLKTAGGILGDIATAKRMEASSKMDISQNLMRQADILKGTSGGVSTQELRRGMIDKGNWGLLARFAYQYPDPEN